MSATLNAQRNSPARSFFRFFSPAPRTRPVPAAPEVPPIISEPAPVQGKKILIVDDDNVIVQALSVILRSHGYAVVTACDGSEAIRAARKEKPDLILLDLTFPPDVAHGGTVNWDGFLIMCWLRRLEEARTIPIIIMSAAEPAGCKERALAAGARAFFRKPIPSDDLLAMVKAAINEGAIQKKLLPASEYQI